MRSWLPGLDGAPQLQRGRHRTRRRSSRTPRPIALTLGEARVDLEQLQVASEHERIGRDLHDTVIQRLFAFGMSLQSIERLATGPVAERIDRVVDGLDEVIRDIRETIFHLERPAMAASGLRSAVDRRCVRGGRDSSASLPVSGSRARWTRSRTSARCQPCRRRVDRGALQRRPARRGVVGRGGHRGRGRDARRLGRRQRDRASRQGAPPATVCGISPSGPRRSPARSR